jgi:DNA polymerase III delta subunit
MLHLFTGDRKKARAAMDAAIRKASGKHVRIVRVSDADASADLLAALRGGGMFGEAHIIVLDSVLSNDEMREMLLAELPALRASDEHFFMLEEKPDAVTRKSIEKHAETSEKFDITKRKEPSNIFALADALRRGDRKNLWIGYQRELGNGAAPEALHGILFWGAKELFMKAGDERSKQRAKKILTELAELPHESRRKGIELEYALERFVLSIA